VDPRRLWRCYLLGLPVPLPGSEAARAPKKGCLALFGGLRPLRHCHLALWSAAKVGASLSGGSCPVDFRTIFGSGVGVGGRERWVDRPKRLAGLPYSDGSRSGAAREVSEFLRITLPRRWVNKGKKQAP